MPDPTEQTAASHAKASSPRQSEAVIPADIAREQLQRGDDRWRAAVRAFDPYPTRLRTLAAAAEYESRAFTAADLANMVWTPDPGNTEIYLAEDLDKRNRARPGPQKLWSTFDRAVADLGIALASESIRAIADAFARVSSAADALADACEAQGTTDAAER